MELYYLRNDEKAQPPAKIPLKRIPVGGRERTCVPREGPGRRDTSSEPHSFFGKQPPGFSRTVIQLAGRS